MPTAKTLLPFLLVACAAPVKLAPPSPVAPQAAPAPAPKKVAEARPADAPLADLETAKLQELLDGLRQPSPLFADLGVRPRVARLARAKGDVQDVYKKVAPATVLVRSATGFGTGVIIDPAGYVLTNHHVVASGVSEDFQVKVWIETGVLSEQGMMEKADTYEAYVHKTDPLLDL
ncbi:MAG: trypsin-like serine protease, partial [Myxococcaceae bacterium]